MPNRKQRRDLLRQRGLLSPKSEPESYPPSKEEPKESTVPDHSAKLPPLGGSSLTIKVGNAANRSIWNHITDHPKIAVVLALLALAVAFSPKASAAAAWWCIGVAFLLTVALTGGAPPIKKSKHPSIYTAVVAVVSGAALLMYGRWLTDQKPSQTVSSLPVIQLHPPSTSRQESAPSLTQSQIEEAVRRAIPSPRPSGSDFDVYTHKLIYDSFDFRQDMKKMWDHATNNPNVDEIRTWRKSEFSRAKRFRARYANIPGIPIRDATFDRYTADPREVKNAEDIGKVFMSFDQIFIKLRQTVQVKYPEYMVRDSDHTEITGPGTVDVRRSNHTKITATPSGSSH